MRAFALVTAVLALHVAVPASAAGEDDERWNDLREALFEDRPIHDGSQIVALEAPYRAHDAAIVPISIEPLLGPDDGRTIKTITLIVDENPAPVAGQFHFSPASGISSIGTRVRVNAYTNVRVVAETGDGQLYMTSRFVKASGGCSAPAGKDQDAALARLGKLKLRRPDPLVPGEPNRAQLLISHPNNTGMQMDQLTRHYVPAHFVTDVEVRYDDEPVFRMQSGISLSEDPSIHFYYVPGEQGVMSVHVRDSKDQSYEASWPIERGDS